VSARCADERSAGHDVDVTDIPRRAVVRTAKLASLPLGVAGRATLGLGKRLGGRPAEVITTELQQRTAEQIFRVLGELKGGAMKFGQALSVFEAALPEEIAAPYRAALTKLQEAAPPLPAGRVHAVLADEFGLDWRERFREFDDQPAAAASIGQVHRAIWRDGRDVAVKIQYPGAGPALLSDLNQLARLARLFAVVSPGLDVKPLLAELKARVAEELDYRLEAAAQEAFATAFEGTADIVVPHVVDHTERVIVTEWITGTPLSRIIRDGTQDERDRAGVLLLRFLFTGPGRVGLLHADPHPGNFRLMPDGRLGVIDFGAVNRLPDGLPEPIGRLARLALAGAADEVYQGLRAEGFVPADVRVDAAAVLDYVLPMLHPLTEEQFHFTRAWLRQEAARVADPRSPANQLGRQLNLPPAYLLIHRVTLGGIGVLCQLGARVAVRAEAERLLPGFAEPGSAAAAEAFATNDRSAADDPLAGLPTPDRTTVVEPPPDDTVLSRPAKQRARRSARAKAESTGAAAGGQVKPAGGGARSPRRGAAAPAAGEAEPGAAVRPRASSSRQRNDGARGDGTRGDGVPAGGAPADAGRGVDPGAAGSKPRRPQRRRSGDEPSRGAGAEEGQRAVESSPTTSAEAAAPRRRSRPAGRPAPDASRANGVIDDGGVDDEPRSAQG
jgi:predicted unusual protein kinase regulating ubiquinone biosynthesis (AarF/ABC1/UbiB family)